MEPSFTVLDFGAGRAGWVEEDDVPVRASMRTIKGKVARFIAADIDPVVLQNQTTDENLLIEDGVVPLPTGSVDLIICDYVLEHVEDPARFVAEVDRLLRPGGYFCARTPHGLNYVSIAARAVRNSQHASILRKVQPTRKAEDVFPTAYKLNSKRAVRRAFKGFEDYSYLYVPEPSYYFGKKLVFDCLSVAHKLLPAPFVGNIFVFMRKAA